MLKRVELWWRRRRIHREHRPLLKKLKASANKDEIRMLEEQYFVELASADEDWRLFYERKLVQKAQRLFLPVPEGNAWEQLPFSSRYALTAGALNELRTKVREELKARREGIVSWVTLLTPLMTGLIGTLTGLIAVWGSK